MKFLIVDDEPDILEVLELLIVSEYQIEIVKAANGQEAISVIKSDNRFDLVISDLKMPIKTGVDVYLALREISNTPFLLLTADNSDFVKTIKNPTAFAHTEKPFDADQLFDRIESLLKSKITTQQKLGYIPVPLQTLLKSQNPGVPLFLRLNENQYIKVINDDGYFNENELQRFKKKGLDSLFIEAADYKTFVRSFNKNTFSNQAWDKVNFESNLDTLNANWDLVIKGSRQFGWSESIVESVKLNVAKTLSLIESEPTLHKHLKKLFYTEQKSHYIAHSYWTLLLCLQIVHELKWDSKLTLQKLTFASLLHDIELTETVFAIKLSLISEGRLNESVYEQAHYHLLNHPSRAAELIQGWSACQQMLIVSSANIMKKWTGLDIPTNLIFNRFSLWRPSL